MCGANIILVPIVSEFTLYLLIAADACGFVTLWSIYYDEWQEVKRDGQMSELIDNL